MGVLLLSSVAGAGVMAVELSAVRLLAPWFGTSLAVWSNVIGVILLALALGYLVGARLSRGASPLAALALLLFAAALLVAWLPALAGPICGLFLPAEVALDQAAPLLAWGSLAAALVLFLPGAVLLGAVGPLAVETLERWTACGAGAAGGRVLCCSTLGSLAGTFATSHALLPGLGLSRTFLVGAGALALAGLAGLWLSRRGRIGGAVGLGLLIAGVPLATPLARLELPTPAGGARVLETLESPYQWVRVIESEVAGAPLRQLQVNEGLDSFQSVWRPEPGLLGEGYYYDQFALPAWWTGATGPWEVLVLGLGAGTALRVIDGASPPGCKPRFTGVELDPAVVELGRRHMQLPADDGRHRILVGRDARVALRALAGPFDQVVLDVYANQFEIPPHLSTVEFFVEVREKLSGGGWLVANVGGFGLDDPVVQGMAATLAAAFGREVLVLRVPLSRNFALFARRDAAPPNPRGEGWLPAGGVPAALLPRVGIPGAWRLVAPGAGPVLTDDHNPIERLQQRSIAQGQARLRGA